MILRRVILMVPLAFEAAIRARYAGEAARAAWQMGEWTGGLQQKTDGSYMRPRFDLILFHFRLCFHFSLF